MKTTIFALVFGFLGVATANAGVLGCFGERQPGPEKILASIEGTQAPQADGTTAVLVSVVSDRATGPTLRKNPGTMRGVFGNEPVTVAFLGGKLSLDISFDGRGIIGSVTLDGQEPISLNCQP